MFQILDKIMRILIYFVVWFLLLVSVAHYVLFPAESNCILIPFHSLKKSESLYYPESVSNQKLVKIKEIIHQSKSRCDSFWKQRVATPTFIYCDSDEMMMKYSGGNHPASTMMKMSGYVVFTDEGLSVDVITHELSHAEIYERVGFLKNLSFPAWLHEGISMQVDYRKNFVCSVSESELIEIEYLITTPQFLSGDLVKNYCIAKNKIALMLKNNSVQEIISDYK